MPHTIQYRPWLINELISSHRIASYSKVFSTQTTESVRRSTSCSQPDLQRIQHFGLTGFQDDEPDVSNDLVTLNETDQPHYAVQSPGH